MEKYYSVEREAENEIVIERSRFITFTKCTPTEEDARAFIDAIRKKHSLATHNCYAYVCERGMIKRFSDDGEPSGTAGTPILEAITHLNLVDTTVVVTRYFGGVKLGAGGLVRAYSKSASECLKIAGSAENSYCAICKLKIPYDKLAKVQSLLSRDNSMVISTSYGEDVEIEFAVYIAIVDNILAELSEILSGSVDITVTQHKYVKL